MSTQRPDDLFEVGGRAWVVGRGWQKIVSIAVALRPSADPAAEDHRAVVEAVERQVPHVLTFEDGTWAYGVQVDAAEAPESVSV